MVRRVTVLVLVASLALAACQTFQYSRGWTNGRKRSNDLGTVVGLGSGRRTGVNLLPAEARRSLQQQTTPHRSLPRDVEERLRAVEAGVSALLHAAQQNPEAPPATPGEQDYYAQN
uniref:Pro-corazonin n=1 Tax=Carcinus maenas TaxID=6759 RepID=A0A2L0WQF3_CARMA|nr:corazonin [Carcinus maenas]